MLIVTIVMSVTLLQVFINLLQNRNQNLQKIQTLDFYIEDLTTGWRITGLDKIHVICYWSTDSFIHS